eukprot:GAHX01000588.1.p1 GENE.GAHX01000588.1~~GAHX01000588.1.p1  ORF type:complete len:161 (-),score=31.81 GAHX01000588.1:55-537(-)
MTFPELDAKTEQTPIGKMKNDQYVTVVGRKKTAQATAYIRHGTGRITVNKKPLDLFTNKVLVAKLYDPINIIGTSYFKQFDISIHVKGGGSVTQVYAVRMAIARAIVAYYQKYVDETIKQEIKTKFLNFDKSLLVVDTRRALPKLFGGKGNRHRFRKSFR